MRTGRRPIYLHLLRAMRPGDVLYLDPPFEGTFDLYVPKDWRFVPDVLVDVAVKAAARGVYVLVSQPASAADLWAPTGAYIHRFARTHKVGGAGGRRTQGEELLVELMPEGLLP